MAALKSKRAIAVNYDGAAETAGNRLQGLENAVVPQNDADGYAREIGKLWDETQQKFIAIGRYLVSAKQTLPHGEYERMVETMLPFGSSAARKLRTVAEAVDTARLPIVSLPRRYVNAYELAVLPEQELRQAEKRQLVRPDVTRREIEAFKREIRQPNHSRHVELLRERQRLMARLAAIDAELERGNRPAIDGQVEDTDFPRTDEPNAKVGAV